jgi:hypothetical protein
MPRPALGVLHAAALADSKQLLEIYGLLLLAFAPLAELAGIYLL